MQVTFTVSTEQAVEMCAFYDKLQDRAMEEVKIAADSRGRKYELSAVKEMMGDALTDEEREMFDSVPF